MAPKKKGGGASASSSAGGGAVRDVIREGICSVCFAKAEKRCEKCKQIWFCSASCLQKGWLLGHRGDCGLSLGNVQVPALPPEYCINTVEKPVFAEQDWRRLADTDAKADRPKGFLNMGNTCYLSAALQCLAAMPAFSVYCGEHAASCQEGREDGVSPGKPAWGGAGNGSASSSDLRCFRCDLARAFSQCRASLEDGAPGGEDQVELEEGEWVQLHGLASADFNGLEGVIMNLPAASDKDGRVAVRLAGTSVAKGVQLEHLRRCQPPCGPRELARWLPRLGESFTFGAQEDAHEFCRSVLRMIGDEQLREHHRGVADRPVGLLAIAEEFTAIPSRVFGGVLVTQCCCTESGCGHSTSRFEPFQDLSLEISEVTDTIEEMLQLFTAPERLDKDNRWTCDPDDGGCGKKVRARKRLMIYQAPQCLVLQLKRFRMGLFGKVNTPITFSAKLNLRPFLSSSAVDDRPEYDLMGVLVHLDKRNISHYGHYVAYVKCPKKGDPGAWQWFLLDDERCLPVPEVEVLRQAAYLLFYTRSPSARKAPSPPALQRAVSGGSSGGYPAEASGPGDGDAQALLRRCAAEMGCAFFAAPGQDLCSKCYRDAFGKAPPPIPDGEASASPAAPAPPPPKAPPKSSAPAPKAAAPAPAGKAGGEEKKKGKIGANEQCPCGSGKKYKKCHGTA